MSVNTSANRFPIDALTVFRASGLATVAASGGSTGAIGAAGVSTGYLTLDELAAYWNTNDNANLQQFAIRGAVESIGQASGGPATASFTVRIDSDPAFTSPAAVVEETSVVLSAAGSFVLVVAKEQIANALATLAVGTTVATPVYLDVYLTIGGGATTPAVAWNAYAAPLVG